MEKIFEVIKKYNLILIGLLALILYIVCFNFGFIYDDYGYIINNSYFNGRFDVSFFDFFKPGYVRQDIYIPFTFICFWGIFKLFGFSSFAFHLINVILYALSCVCFGIFIKKIIKNDIICLLSVLFFTIYPGHIESTAWISAMGYNLAAIFFFLSFTFFISAFDEDKKLNYLYSILFYIISILSQPVAIVLPALILLWGWCFRKDKFLKVLKIDLLYFVFCGFYLFLFKIVFSDRFINVTKFLYNVDYSNVFHTSFLEKLAVFGKYLFLAFIPVNLLPIYPFPLNIYSIFTICFLAFLIYILFYNKSEKIIFFSIWGIITIMPYSCILFDSLPMANRYLVFFSVSSFVALSYFCLFIYEKFKKYVLLKYLPLFLILGIYIYSFVGFMQVWKNENSFWAYAYKTNPSYLVTYNYALNLVNNKDFFGALELSDIMIEKYSKKGVFSNNYEYYELKTKCLISLNRLDEAIDMLNLSIEKIPNYYRWYFYLFDIYFYRADCDKLQYVIDSIGKFDKRNFLKNDSDLFEQLKMLFYYTNADTDKFIESFSVITNKLSNVPIYLKDDIQARDFERLEKSCLKYINEYPDSMNRKNVIMILNCIYMNKKYGDDSKIKMRYFLKEMYTANQALFNKDFENAEKKYLDIIDKDKYMFDAYFKLIEVYIKTNKFDEAKNICKKLLLIIPLDKKANSFLNYLESTNR